MVQGEEKVNEAVQDLMNMGFEKEKVKKALKAAYNNR